jgi:mono/diheme cytochrome c family protein
MRTLPAFLMFTVALTAAATALASDGAALFAQNCALCHQSDAAGLRAQFPRLAGRAGLIGGAPAGRRYLIHVVSFGLSGSITVDKEPITGVMPSFGQLGDEDVAALLSYLQGLGIAASKRPSPVTTEEVTLARASARMSGAEVLAERRVLETAKIIP